MGIEYKTLLLGATMTFMAGTAMAHGDKPDADSATKPAVKAEQKPFGIAGNPAKVTRTVKMDLSDEMRFHPSVLHVKRGETVRFVVANSGKVLHEMVIGTGLRLTRVERQRESRIKTISKRIMEAVAWMTALILLLMMILITYDVFLRYFFEAPARWIDDFISLYLIIYVTMLPAAWILLRGEHVSVGVFVDRLKPVSRDRLNLFTNILCLIYSLALTWQGTLFTWRELTHRTTSPTTAYLPVWPAVAVIFIGGILLSLASILKISNSFLERKSFSSKGESVG